MRKSFLRVKKRAPGSLLFSVLMIGTVCSFLLWVFLSINPFQPANPFLREATLGQAVIGDWRYGGVDANGNMKFYNAYQYGANLVIPKKSTTFAADGIYVVLDGHTSTTLTYEPAYESEVIGPAIFIWIILLVAAFAVLIFKKRKPRHHYQKRRRPVGRVKPKIRS